MGNLRLKELKAKDIQIMRQSLDLNSGLVEYLLSMWQALCRVFRYVIRSS